jgi:hypothetical protein
MRVLITETYVLMVPDERCRYAEVEVESIDEARAMYEEATLGWEDGDKGGDIIDVEFEELTEDKQGAQS